MNALQPLEEEEEEEERKITIAQSCVGETVILETRTKSSAEGK